MPVISIKSLPPDNKINTSGVLKKLCTEFAARNGYKSEHVWAYWDLLAPNNYAVGKKTQSRQTVDTHSPIINILAFEGNPPEKIKNILETTASIISEQLEIDIGNIFITYSEAHSGRVFDGGTVIYSR